MKQIFLFFVSLFPGKIILPQPYVEPVQVRHTYAFPSQHSNRATPFTHFWAGSDLPVKTHKGYLLLSPYFENWQFDSASVNNVLPGVKSLVMPVGLLMPLNNPKWTLALNAMVRTNGEQLFVKKTFQAGGAVFLSYEKAEGKKFRFGVYVNEDFFGLFLMPLLGADWRMNEKNYFFGLLPGRFTWEHKFSKSFYGGITFRALTNSYRLRNGNFLRIDDNQLSSYLDLYPSKNICITFEPGYGIMRKLRTGSERRKYHTNNNWGDGFFIKLSAAYRIRFEEKK
ncbi:MAG: hypothetical protein IPM85_17680 [Chitinophagaceae bacterium]|nr:hypothetical protein [Chitinophagaceae bacterium]